MHAMLWDAVGSTYWPASTFPALYISRPEETNGPCSLPWKPSKKGCSWYLYTEGHSEVARAPWAFALIYYLAAAAHWISLLLLFMVLTLRNRSEMQKGWDSTAGIRRIAAGRLPTFVAYHACKHARRASGLGVGWAADGVFNVDGVCAWAWGQP